MIRWLRSLARDQRGTAIVELAAVSPMLAIMIAGTLDVSNAYARKLELEQAAQRSMEKVFNTTGDDTPEATIISEAASQANVPTSNVTVTYRVECNGSVTTAETCDTGQKEAKWIQVTVVDTYTAMLPLLYFGNTGDGKYHLSAVAGIRVE